MSEKRHNRVQFSDTMEHYLCSLIEQKSYADAVDYFESHQKQLTDMSGDAAGAIYHLASRAYASLSHYATSLKTARMAQHLASAHGDSLLLADICMTLGSTLKKINELKEAEKAYRDAESIFRRYDSPEGQSRALNMLAGLFFKKNDYKNSLSMLMDALEIARQLDDKKKMAYMMGNIGRIHTFTGNFTEAIKYLQLNVDLSNELHDNLESARALLSVGYIYMQQAEYGKAETTFAEALPLIQAAESKPDEIIYLTYLGELYYRTSRFDDSRETLTNAYRLGCEISPESTMVGRALRHSAELEIRTEEYRTASRHIAQSWVIMEKAGDKVELGALTKLKAIVAEQGENTDAKALYSRAIDLLGESNVRFEQADALVAAGKSNLFSERQRITYLFRAEEFYRRHGFTKQVHHVEQVIDSMDKPSPETMIPHPTQAGICPDAVDFITSSKEIEQFKCQLPLMGHTDLPLLLTGETGAGKDHMARFFHQMVRPDSPFVAINCASLPENLLESELFGYQRGAFTGADKNKPGLFVTANGGVLFLDEIGDMPLSLQTKLLGVLENRQVIPLGGTKSIDLDVKLVAATNQNLEEMVERGEFRRDLYYRISGLSFKIPPLRERKEDIPLLLRQFMKAHHLLGENDKLPSELVRQFIEYDWPGNTRELYNKVKRLKVMTQMVVEGDLVELTRSMFTESVEEPAGSLFDRVEQFERKILVEALLAAHGNKSEAARILGIHEATVRTKLKRYNISLSGMQYN